MSEEGNYEKEIRDQITKRYNNRAEFFGNLAAFIVCNLILWGALSPQGFWHTIAILITAGWGLGLVIQFINFVMSESRENAIAKALERDRESRAYEKPKNDRNIRLGLTDDGEIQEVYEDDASQTSERGQR